MGRMRMADSDVIDWTQSPTVKMAAKQCGWPDCDLAVLLAAIIEVKDLESEILGRLGVSLTELAERAQHAEATRSSASAVQWAVESGLEPAMASRIFQTPPEAGVDPTPVAVTIAELHSRGMGPAKIAKAAGVSVWKTYDSLARLGLTPNNEKEQLKMRDAQVYAYQAQGLSCPEIAQALGIKLRTVRGIVQRNRLKTAVA